MNFEVEGENDGGEDTIETKRLLEQVLPHIIREFPSKIMGRQKVRRLSRPRIATLLVNYLGFLSRHVRAPPSAAVVRRALLLLYLVSLLVCVVSPLLLCLAPSAAVSGAPLCLVPPFTSSTLFC